MTGFHDSATLDFEEPRKRVTVIQAPANARPAVLDWIERALPVSFFEPDGSGDPDALDGALVLDPERLADAPRHVPRLVLAARAHGQAETGLVALSEDRRLARPIRGRSISESATLGKLEPQPRRGGDVLARAGDEPLWWEARESSASLYYSRYPLAELADGQTLREYLRAGAFMGLLPLLQFLGELLGEEGWTSPAPRAAFVIDDPNLHWPSYGYLKYRELATHAMHHGYHLGFATVPLDGWRAEPRAVALVRDNPAALSLLIHGNDHVARELARLSTDEQAEQAMAQALRRIVALERRTGLSVARVMAPPHGACSEAALRAMFRLGFDAACISRPYPWRDGLPAPTPLAGWHPAELVAGGIPVAPRHPLSAAREDLPFRALLGQPLILYGHHDDFSGGLDLLAQASADINSLGEVRWGSLGSVAGGGYATRRLGDTLLVRMYARKVSIALPEGVGALRILAQEPLGGAGWHGVCHAGGVTGMAFADGMGVSASLPVHAPSTLDLELVTNRPLDSREVAAPALRPWPLIRRLLVEGRDRVQPLV